MKKLAPLRSLIDHCCGLWGVEIEWETPRETLHVLQVASCATRTRVLYACTPEIEWVARYRVEVELYAGASHWEFAPTPGSLLMLILSYFTYCFILLATVCERSLIFEILVIAQSPAALTRRARAMGGARSKNLGRPLATKIF